MSPARSAAAASHCDYAARLARAWQLHRQPRSAQAPAVVSLFAGCGGSSLGYSLAGFRELLAVECDANAVATYQLNFPDTKVYHGDIAQLTGAECLRLAGLRPGELDVLDGSPPCQGFSLSGRRLMQDARNYLYLEYVRLLEALQPRAFIMENVGGLVTGKMKLVFAEMLRALRGAGYQVSVRLLNSAYFGVPQARRRLIFAGMRGDLGTAPSHPPATHCQPITVRQALQDVVNDPAELAELREAGRRFGAYSQWHRLRPGQNLPDITGRTAGFSCVKVDPDKPAPTICKNDGLLRMHGLMHWAERRRFTTAEYKRLMSFPDEFQFAGSWSDAVQRMGNAVPPLLLQAVAAHLRQLLEAAGSPASPEQDPSPGPRLAAAGLESIVG